MRKLASRIARLLSIHDERGVTAIEYGMLAALVALAIIVAVTLLGTNLSAVFNSVATQVAVPK